MRWTAVLAAASVAAILAAPGGASRTTTMQLGSTVTFTGQTGSRVGSGTRVRATGTVVLTARWGSRGWYLVVRVHTDGAGRYRARMHPSHRGTYTIRIRTPDNRPPAVFVLQVI